MNKFFIFGACLVMLSFGSAMEIGEGCCSLNADGSSCGVSVLGECGAGATFAEGALCATTSFCKKGCCYDDDTGVYDKNVMKTDCSFASWVDDPNCNLPGANLGCCVLGTGSVYETRGQCAVDSLARALGADEGVDWRGGIGEVGCLLMLDTQKEGACSFGEGVCKFGTEVWCLENNGDFSENYLCTSPELNTNCVMTRQTTCVEGKDEVYFVDSCGNIGNVYDSSKVEDVTYWSFIVADEDLCGEGEGNENSKDCGNCDRFAGGICASAGEDGFEADVGEFYCRDTACMFDGASYENGESWCTYDGAIGNGDDVVGSRHWRYVCSQGVVQIEPCADERKEICVQTDTYEADGGEVDFRTSKCIDNNWAECISLNDEESTVDDCNSAAGCFSKHIEINNFKFDVCVPKYPRGFDWSNREATKSAKSVCGLASQTCTQTYAKNWEMKWECVQNCDCSEQTFTDQMHELCRGLGDCGAYVNIEGAYTDGSYSVTRGTEVISDSLVSKYIVNAEVVEGQVARPDGGYSLGGGGALMEVLQGDISLTAHDLLENEGTGIWTNPAINPSPYVNFIQVFGLDKEKAKWLDLGGYYLFDYLFGDTENRDVDFECKPWRPPTGGDNCEVCNNPLKPCSAYRCHSLGGSCTLLNEGSGQELCIDDNPNDVTPPVLAPQTDVISENEVYGDISSSGFSLTSVSGGCVDAYTELEFGVLTDEPAYCKFDIEMKEFDEMIYDLGSNLYVHNHSVLFTLPDPSHGQSQGIDWVEDTSFFIKCQDSRGHETPAFYEVKTCVKEGEDVTVPMIRKIEPSDGVFVSFDSVSRDVEINTNELSVCKWDASDVEYSLMGNTLNCEDSLGAASSAFGYVCRDTLPIGNSSNIYYIKCMDQPWLTEGGNANVESFVYVLNKPSAKISIDKIKPDSVFEVATDLTTIDLKVGTSGGAESHRCSYSLSGYENMIEMFETGDVGTHSQSLNIPAGKHKIYVQCEDETGDFTRNLTEFEIIKDVSAPSIARVWQTGGFVSLVLSEEGECRFSFDGCKDSWNESYNIGTGETLRFAVVRGERYFIKCKDEFGNVPSGCSITVEAV